MFAKNKPGREKYEAEMELDEPAWPQDKKRRFLSVQGAKQTRTRPERFYVPPPPHLSVFGLQAKLVPADGLDVSGLGQDLDAFRSLHQQGASGRLQPGNTHNSALKDDAAKYVLVPLLNGTEVTSPTPLPTTPCDQRSALIVSAS